MTYREAKVIQHQLRGESTRKALIAAGFGPGIAANPHLVITEEMRTELVRLQTELVAQTLDAGLIDATEIHEYLTEALRADMRDIRNDDGSFKPQSEWPAIWGRMMEAGDCEIETLNERSHDDATQEKRGGWDVSGTVTKVKLKFSSRAKLLELAMRHKGVNAMVEQKVGDVNILVVTAEKARQVSGAKKRLAKVIEVKAK